MTNINCSYDCIYQKNGICCYDNVNSKTLNSDNDCIYYEKKESET